MPGAERTRRMPKGRRPLMVVARTGNVEAAKLLLKSGAKIGMRARHWGGQTALMWAAAQGQPEMIRFLLSRGAQRERALHGARLAAPRDGRRPSQGHEPRWSHAAAVRGARGLHRLHARAAGQGAPTSTWPIPDGTTPLVLALLNRNWDAAQVPDRSAARM